MNVIVTPIKVGDETHTCYCTGQCRRLKYCPNQKGMEEDLERQKEADKIKSITA